MNAQAALLLVFCLGCALQTNAKATERISPKANSVEDKTSKTPLDNIEPLPIFSNPHDLLLKEIQALNKDAENEKMQEEVGKTLKAEAEKSTIIPNVADKFSAVLNKSGNTIDVNKLLKDDLALKNEDSNDEDEDDEEDDDDMDDDDMDEDYNADYEDDLDDDSDDEEDDDEKISNNCPKSCKCVKGYQAISAKCNTLDDTQIFGGGISHLEVIGSPLEPKRLNLGPHALHAYGLQQLESVKFVDVEFTKFDRTVFDGLRELFTVNITRTSLQTLDPDLFQNCTRLNILAISSHNFKYNQNGKTKEYLLNAPSLNEIVFSNNSLTKLPRMAFAKMPELLYISLKDNQLTTLDRVTFRTLQNLGELDVSNNLLNYFTPKFFEGLELRTLRIANNKFTSLRSLVSKSLTVLDASGNKIKHITKDDLSGIPSVDQLILKSNGMIRINPHAFSRLDQLTFLDISDNSISSITESHFISNPRLQILIMNDNPDLQSLPIFKSNTEEHGAFSIYRFECSNCGLKFLEEKTFDAMPALARLNLSKNRLTYIPNYLFRKHLSLRDLDLSDNMISELEAEMFAGAVSLTKLNLAGNFLKSLQVTPFSATSNLFRLDVSRNNLERVWSEAREPLKSLRSLSVRGNNLKRYTVEELKATPKLSGLNMNDNPLVCDKDFKETIEYLTKNGIVPKQSLVSSEDFNFNYESITQWSDLAKKVCQFLDEGPPSKIPDNFPVRINGINTISSSVSSTGNDQNDVRNESLFDDEDDEDDEDEDENENDDQMAYNQDIGDGIISFTSSNQEEEFEEELLHKMSYEYRSWYSAIMWPVMITILVTLVVFWLVAVSVYVSKRRRNGPVIRPPMILRQGFGDNKNCGLVYKPLQEEIATPHMPKRGSFYSSSTFHYDKIVPESV